LWPVDRSRMNREVHFQNCEGVGVKLPALLDSFLGASAKIEAGAPIQVFYFT
jgi:hypothetical protein